MTPIQLRTRQEFEANPKAYVEKPTKGDPLGPVGAFLGAYCAGMNDRATPETVHDAMLNEPRDECDANPTIRWLLGSVRVWDLVTLNTRSGVPIGRIADHLRWHELRRPDVIRFLNQFAVPGRTARV